MAPRVLLSALALCAASTGVPAATVVDAETVHAKLAQPAGAALAKELSALKARGATLEIVALLRERVLAGELDETVREALLDDGVHALAQLPPSPASQALVAELTSREPRLFVRVDPDHSGRGVPLYDVGATAKFAQRAWLQRETRDFVTAAIARRDAGLIEAFAAVGATQDAATRKAGFLEAFVSASTPALLAYRPALVASMEAGGNADELLSLFARRLNDAELYTLLFERASDSIAVRAIGDAASALHDDAAVSVLRTATHRPELASAALLALGDIARNHSGARQFLFDALRHPLHGASAAAALGKLQDPALAAELGRLLAAASDENARRRIALALHFDGSDAARRQLQTFAQSGKGSRELRKEIATWLAR